MKRVVKLTEQDLYRIVKRVIKEQEVQDSKYPPISFEESFAMNMVTIQNNQNVQQKLAQLDKLIIDAGGELLRIDITINAGHSPEAATNGLPQGYDKPDHDYGGILSMNVCSEQIKEKCWMPFNRASEKTRVTDGNKYLAQQRANNLKLYLESYLTKKYPKAKINITLGTVGPSDKRFVNAVITFLRGEKKKPKAPYVYGHRAYEIKSTKENPNLRGAGTDGDFYWYCKPKGPYSDEYDCNNITWDTFKQYVENKVEDRTKITGKDDWKLKGFPPIDTSKEYDPFLKRYLNSTVR